MKIFFGIRILDSALVQAAKLSSRYITNRNQPDKSIDLIDEACSSLRVQLDSKPDIIDQLERKKITIRNWSNSIKKRKRWRFN